MGKKEEYGAEAITVLEGLEAVRRRPGMYIGSTSTKGLNHLIYEIMDNSVDEHMAGFCDTISVTLNADGSATISDNGRGIPVDRHEKGITRVGQNQNGLTRVHIVDDGVFYLILAFHKKVYSPCPHLSRWSFFVHQYLQNTPMDICSMRMKGGRLERCVIRLCLEDFLQLMRVSLHFFQ